MGQKRVLISENAWKSSSIKQDQSGSVPLLRGADSLQRHQKRACLTESLLGGADGSLQPHQKRP